MPVKKASHTRKKPLALASDHGRYVTAPEVKRLQIYDGYICNGHYPTEKIACSGLTVM
jgi:hypothetical protein